ncbi:DUF6262 family protein (plasmid) [Mycolicibacterium aubagnense]|uniref:DUF6262 family protein n=1 Tax=Mycolicibacterium aubagnense TaxID=319707 RepID=UPI00244DC4F7|nr:DUF6262 family protein [Mycolicibacterium aubagnense]WGI36131.1 DUF6262 family protein [Mycolicibacterium aubagnense]
MSVSPQSEAALAASARQRTADVDERIERAFKKMRKQGSPITLSGLAREANVSRSVIHRRPKVREQIRSYQPLTTVPDEPPPAAADSESSIIAALRARLKAKDAQLAELKNQLRERDTVIATLHGELARRPRSR